MLTYTRAEAIRHSLCRWHRMKIKLRSRYQMLLVNLLNDGILLKSGICCLRTTKVLIPTTKYNCSSIQTQFKANETVSFRQLEWGNWGWYSVSKWWWPSWWIGQYISSDCTLWHIFIQELPSEHVLHSTLSSPCHFPMTVASWKLLI